MHLMFWKMNNWLKFKLSAFPKNPELSNEKKWWELCWVCVCGGWGWNFREWNFLEKIYKTGQAHIDGVTSFCWRRSAEHHADHRCLPLGEMISFPGMTVERKSVPPFGTCFMLSCNIISFRNVLSLHYNNSLFMCLIYPGFALIPGCLRQFGFIPVAMV